MKRILNFSMRSRFKLHISQFRCMLKNKLQELTNKQEVQLINLLTVPDFQTMIKY